MSTPAPVTEQERIARAALSATGEPGDPRIGRLLVEVGATPLWQALREQAPELLAVTGTLREQARPLAEDLAGRARAQRPEDLIGAAAAHGVRFVVPGDPEWPRGLDDLVWSGEVQRRGGPPPGLWVRSARPLDEVLGTRAVALVGSRSATGYGVHTAADLAAGVGAARTAVVSGGAFGVDQAAHRGALAVDAGTVAVLACGPDRAYPAAHRDLLDHIAETGAVVSELPPGATPTRVRFLARNRLIAAMSQGTVVVEAAVRSGALNTANWATSLHRELMGVPGPVTSAASAGVHELIRSRGATLVTRAEEVVELLGDGDTALEPPRAAETVRDRLPAELRETLEGLPWRDAATPAALARDVGRAPGRVAASLDGLERMGLVRREGDGWCLTERARASVDLPAERPTLPW